MSRRQALGAGAASVIAGAISLLPGHAVAATNRDTPDRPENNGGNGEEPDADDAFQTTFGRMFPQLPPFAAPTEELAAALLDFARPGGPLDANDDLAAGPVQLIVDPSKSVGNRDNPNHTAGTTFFGQFLDHDSTFDVGSTLGVPAEPTRSLNGRSPRFDLDSVYGGGPSISHELYDPTDPVKLRVESGGVFEDLPRAADAMAVIADPRNDENLVIAGLHCAFLLAHNHAIDVERTAGRGSHEFLNARRLVRWHYQWMIVHQFLPQVIGQNMVDDILQRGRRHFRPGDGAFTPVEFQGAAYRMGHSMVRPSYRANLAGNPGGKPFFGFIFDPGEQGKSDPEDLSGGARSPRRFVGWQTFFDFGDGQVKRNKRLDTRLSTPLFNLPIRAIFGRNLPTVLPQRTLLRHVTWSLPSGQAIAQAIGATPITPDAFAELADYGLGLDMSTPLWYYVLKEAELLHDGLQLGPVGGRIVGEVFLGLLQLDRTSYLHARRPWRPVWPTRNGPELFDMVDFLTFAGVAPSNRGQ